MAFYIVFAIIRTVNENRVRIMILQCLQHSLLQKHTRAFSLSDVGNSKVTFTAFT